MKLRGMGNITLRAERERHLQNFCHVQGTSGRALGDLLAATEAVSDDQPIGRGLAHGGKELELADGHGDVIFVAFEAEGSRHAAAAGSRSLEVDAKAAQQGFFRGHSHQRFLMAMSVKKCFASEMRKRKILGIGFKEFTEQESLPR